MKFDFYELVTRALRVRRATIQNGDPIDFEERIIPEHRECQKTEFLSSISSHRNRPITKKFSLAIDAFPSGGKVDGRVSSKPIYSLFASWVRL